MLVITAIDNYSVYLNKMSKTFEDKCWWISEVSCEIDTIIDFGCANAGIFEYIELRFPGRFTYIGIDENKEMLNIAKAKYTDFKDRVSFYSSLKNVPDFNSDKTILILNSVIHELFSYKTNEEIADFICSVNNLKPAYIAIRDMHKCKDESVDVDKFTTIKVQYPKEFAEHTKYTSHRVDDINFYLEFLLKYFYKENWAREVKECYLWNWSDIFEFTNYKTEKEIEFGITFLKEKWLKDLNVLFENNTHKKILYKRKEI